MFLLIYLSTFLSKEICNYFFSNIFELFLCYGHVLLIEFFYVSIESFEVLFI